MHIEHWDYYLRARYLLGRIVKCRETPQYPQDLGDGLKISFSQISAGIEARYFRLQ